MNLGPLRLLSKSRAVTFVLGALVGHVIYQVFLSRSTVYPPQSQTQRIHSNKDNWKSIEKSALYPKLFVVTPTHRNPLQLAQLTQLAQALYPARNFVKWLIYEDADKVKLAHPNQTDFIREHLQGFWEGLDFEVNWSTRTTGKEIIKFEPKGVEGRRDAIALIREFNTSGVIFFADDDNSYDSDIFRQIQHTKGVSIWPVGAVTGFGLSAPVIGRRGHLIEFFDGFKVNRRFPLDFAGFAINNQLLIKNPNANIPWIAGYEETVLLSSLNLTRSDLKVLSSGATELLTWHTKHLSYDTLNISLPLPKSFVGTNIEDLNTEYSFIRIG